MGRERKFEESFSWESVVHLAWRKALRANQASILLSSENKTKIKALMTAFLHLTEYKVS